MAPPSRQAIPVPNNEQGRPVPGRGSEGGRRRMSGTNGGVGSNRAAAVNQQARRPSMRDATQAPWRSSLDLVWSYSRSQAFYGENISTSPSFADRHWAGPSNGSGDYDETSIDEEEDLEESDFYDDDDEYDAEYQDEDRRSRLDSMIAASPAGPMEWNDEQLPPNAVSRQSSRGVLGRRERRGSRDSSPGRRGNFRVNNKDGGNVRTINRNIKRITDDVYDEDERSRSRSRSPKRVGLSRPSSSGLRPSSSSSLRKSDDDERGSLPALRSIQSNLRKGRQDTPANESTPLLQEQPGHYQSTSNENGQSDHQYPRRPRFLQTPSWFRNSSVSVTSGKFRMQGYGCSTFWQSWFNTLNALIGIGILALPLAISYAGLIPGILLFLLSGLVTNYTGKVLANIMAAEPSLRTYADIGNFAFGTRARLLVSFFFCLELWAVSTALVILFGDSLNALVVYTTKEGHPSNFILRLADLSPSAYKAIGVLIVLPTMFLPLRLLSPISVIGIISVFTLFIVVFSDGLIKKTAPGSLWEPMQPDLGPLWMRFPLSFGLIMSGFSSHPIIPSLFKDMRNPRQFCQMLNWAYIAATIIYLGMGLIGYLMFGRQVSDEITRDLANTEGYPRVLNKMAIWLIIINPLSKFALAARPLVTTVELILGVEQSQTSQIDAQKNVASKSSRSNKVSEHEINVPDHPTSSATPPSTSEEIEQPDLDAREDDLETISPEGQEESPLMGSTISIRAAQRTAGWSKLSKLLTRTGVQIVITIAIGLTAIILPGFEKVMAFLGAFLACVTCIFGPLLANLRLFRHEMSTRRILLDCFILFVTFFIAIIGTIWSFIPIPSRDF